MALKKSEIYSSLTSGLAALDSAIHGEMDRISQQLTRRVKELAERYEAPLPKINRARGGIGSQSQQTSGENGIRAMSNYSCRIIKV
jgi:hypothetical protein